MTIKKTSAVTQVSIARPLIGDVALCRGWAGRRLWGRLATKILVFLFVWWGARAAMLKMGTSEVGLEGKEVKICIVGEEGEDDEWEWDRLRRGRLVEGQEEVHSYLPRG
jgi:hypothetical protein